MKCRELFEQALFCFMGFASNIVYTTVAPVLPLQIEKRNLMPFYSGLIFCSMSVGYCCVLLVSKKLIKRCGRLPSVFFMFVFLSAELLMFGLAKEFSSDAVFITLCLICRLGQGLATSFIIATLMTMITEYYQNYPAYITVQILGIQIAELVGPLWGGLLFDLIGYTGIFVAQSATALLAGFCVCFFRQHEREHPLLQIDQPDFLSYWKLLKVPGLLFGAMAFIVSEAFFMSIDPILPYKLSSAYGFKQFGIGIFFFYFTGVVVLVSFILLFIPERVNKYCFIMVGCFLAAVGAFLTGPSGLFGLPDILSLIKAGMIVSGVAKAFIQCYAVPYAVKSGQSAFRDHQEQVERKAPMIVTSSFGIAAGLIPLIMSALFKAYNFRTTLNVVGVLFTVNAFAFLIHSATNNWGREPVKEKKTGNDEEQSLIP